MSLISTAISFAGGNRRVIRFALWSIDTSGFAPRSIPASSFPVTTTSERFVDPYHVFWYATTSRTVASLDTSFATVRICETTTSCVMLVLLVTVGRGTIRVAQYPTAITTSSSAPVIAAPVLRTGRRFRLSDSMAPAPEQMLYGQTSHWGAPVVAVHPEYISRSRR
jgi:hypothetical protein